MDIFIPATLASQVLPGPQPEPQPKNKDKPRHDGKAGQDSRDETPRGAVAIAILIGAGVGAILVSGLYVLLQSHILNGL